jgi:hypothetical protein
VNEVARYYFGPNMRRFMIAVSGASFAAATAVAAYIGYLRMFTAMWRAAYKARAAWPLDITPFRLPTSSLPCMEASSRAG